MVVLLSSQTFFFRNFVFGTFCCCRFCLEFSRLLESEEVPEEHPPILTCKIEEAMQPLSIVVDIFESPTAASANLRDLPFSWSNESSHVQSLSTEFLPSCQEYSSNSSIEKEDSLPGTLRMR